MFKDKRILLLVKELTAFPMYFVAEELKKNNEIGVFFVHPEESFYNKCNYNKNSYYKFKEFHHDLKIYTPEKVGDIFNREIETEDLLKLKKYEENYSIFKNLNTQLISSQLSSKIYHSRFFFKKTNYNENLNFLIYAYENCERVIFEFKPDIILDLDEGELFRTVINEICHKVNIEYLTIDYPRIEDFKICTNNLGLKDNKYLKKVIDENSKTSNHNTEGINYLKNFQEKEKIMSKEFIGHVTSQYKPISLYKMIKVLIGKVKYFFNVYYNNPKYIFSKSLLISNPFNFILYFFKLEIKKQYLFRKNKYFTNPSNEDKYLYMPLHLIPESSTFVRSPYFINELFLIEQISKALPIDMFLYVKEHQSMLGERNFDFYKKVKSFHNVKLVQINYYDDPLPWIKNSLGVITITGTAALEAAFLNKKSFVFGNVPFININSIKKISNFEELWNELNKLDEEINNADSVTSYIQAVFDKGKKINLKYLFEKGEYYIQNNIKPDEQYKSQISNIISLFYNFSTNN